MLGKFTFTQCIKWRVLMRRVLGHFERHFDTFMNFLGRARMERQDGCSLHSLTYFVPKFPWIWIFYVISICNDAHCAISWEVNMYKFSENYFCFKLKVSETEIFIWPCIDQRECRIIRKMLFTACTQKSAEMVHFHGMLFI